MSDVLEIRVKKSHVAVLSIVVLVASASAAVNVRDPMNVFGDLNVRGGELDMHQNEITNTTEVEFSSDYLKDYAGQDGKIDDAGLVQASQDFGSDKLSASQLRTVETFFQNKIPVKNNILEEYDSDGNNKITEEELQGATRDFIVDGELSKGEIDLIQYYFRNEVPITEPASSIDAAKITSSGKLIASGIIGRQKANFTIGNDINMRGNNIYNIGNLNGQTGGTTGGGGGSGGSLSMPKGSFSCEGPEGCGSNPVKTFDPANGYLVSAQIEMAGTDGVGSFDSTSIRLNYVDGSSSTYKVSDDLSARSKKIHAYNTPNKKVDTIDVLVDAGSGDFYTSDHSVKWALVSGGTGEDGQTGGGGGLGDDTGLEWYKSSTTNEDYSDDKTFSFGCPSGENLVAYHGATSGQGDTPPPWYGSWLGPIDTSGNIDYGHPGRVNNHIAGRVMGINSSDTDSLSVSIQMDSVQSGYDKTFATINVGCLPGQ